MAKKEPLLTLAAAVAEAVKKTGGPAYVFASVDRAALQVADASAFIATHEFVKSGCVDCGHETHALAGTKPFCLVCGGLTEQTTEAKTKLKIHADEHLTAIACSVCGTTNTFHQAIASACDHVHCSSCGSEMSTARVVQADAMDGDADPAEVTMDDLPEVDATGDDDGLAIDGGDPAADTGAAFGDDAGDGAAPDAVDTEDAESCDPAKPAPAAADADELPNNDPNAIDADAVDGLEPVDMLDAVADDADPEDMSVISSSKKIQIAYKDCIVARLLAEKAGDNQEIFETAGFRGAIIASLQSHGLKQTVADFHFEPIVVKVKGAKHVAKLVQAGVATEATKLQKVQAAYVKDMGQCLALAQVGLNKGYWADSPHPLKDALVAELSAAGVKKPAQLVNRVFAKAGIAFTESLVAKANELSGLSVDIRNQMSKSLDMVAADAGMGGDDGLDAEADADEEGLETPVSESRVEEIRREKAALHDGPTKKPTAVAALLKARPLSFS